MAYTLYDYFKINFPGFSNSGGLFYIKSAHGRNKMSNDGYDWKRIEELFGVKDILDIFDIDTTGDEDLYAPIPQRIIDINILLDLSQELFEDRLTNDELLWQAFQHCISNIPKENDIIILRSLLVKEIFQYINKKVSKH